MNLGESLLTVLRTASGLFCCLLWLSPALAVNEPILPLVAPDDLDQRKVALGQKLFHDVRLSADQTISCASCHELATGGADGQAVSTGIKGARGNVNAPTVFNSGNNFRQFWDGRAASLEEQVDGPLNNPVEMGSNWPLVEARLGEDAAMLRLFDAIYEDGLNSRNIIDSIAEFERSLVTVNSPFDAWLLGDEKALTELQLKGYQLFQSYGCIACHQGRNVGSNMYAQMGEMGDYFGDRPMPAGSADNGHFNVTGDERDRHSFKVPGLRLVGRTAPYFHDGSVDTLDEAVTLMARYQLGRGIAEADLEAIMAFLYSLEGSHPALDSHP